LSDFRRTRMGERRAEFQFADKGARLPAQREHLRGARAGFHGVAVAARRAAAILADAHSGHAFGLFVDSSSSSL
jgi:hypothetical protein